jgi:dCMP deaminase
MIAWAARTGTPLLDTTIWCTHQPCLPCAKLLINAGIKALVWAHAYRDPRGLELIMNQDIPTYHYPMVPDESTI